MTMIEHVARAATLTQYKQWDGLKPEIQQSYLAIARAAIAAMREPTEEMKLSVGCDDKHDIEFWQAMIDAALEEK